MHLSTNVSALTRNVCYVYVLRLCKKLCYLKIIIIIFHKIGGIFSESNTYKSLLVSRSSLEKKTPLLTLLNVSEIHCTARCTEENMCLYVHHRFDNTCYVYKEDELLPQANSEDQSTVIYIKRPG